MYAHKDGFVEDCYYDDEHTWAVAEAVEKNFEEYFERFVETDGGLLLSDSEFSELKKKFAFYTNNNSKDNNANNFKLLIAEAYEEFEKDRQKYLNIFDDETLEEWEDDPATFKSKVLRQECPIIHSTLYNKRAKELDKYRYEFSKADPEKLLATITNLYDFANEYMSDYYDEEAYDIVNVYSDLGLEKLDTEEYTVFGVIGGGIKSHLLYKFQPSAFPNRSRNAIWAFWYLTGKEKFDCEMDSEFIMIDVEKSTVQQNYFYPYELFSYYAHEVYLLLKEKAEEMGVYIDPRYKYVVVDRFLNYVAEEHSEEISLLKSQIRDGGPEYA